jgi:hypothetical protein
MVLVRMAISLYGKAKSIPGYIKQPPIEHIDEKNECGRLLAGDQIEGHFSSEGKIVLEVHRQKTQAGDAKRDATKLESELNYFRNQISKINKELQDGRLGRKGDLDRFEAKAAELQNEIRIKNDIVDSARVERIEFLIEDCN